MNNTLFIDSEIMNDFPDFVDGFLKTAYWTTKEKDNANVLITKSPILNLNNHYGIGLAKKKFDSIIFTTSLYNKNIVVELTTNDHKATLLDYIQTDVESKAFDNFQKQIDKHAMTDYEFGQYISAIISDALIEDKIRSNAV